MAGKPVDLTLTTTWQVIDQLDRLVRTGLYGATREAAAEELIRGRLRAIFPPATIPPPAAELPPLGDIALENPALIRGRKFTKTPRKGEGVQSA